MLGRWAWAERVSWSVDKCKSHVRRRFSELFGVVFGETRAIPSFGDTTYLVSCISGNNTSSASPDKYYILLEQSHLAAIIFGLHRGLVAHRAWLHRCTPCLAGDPYFLCASNPFGLLLRCPYISQKTVSKSRFQYSIICIFRAGLPWVSEFSSFQ